MSMRSLPSAPKSSITKFWDGVGTLVQYTFQKFASATQFTPVTHATNDRPYGVVQRTIEVGHAAQIPLDLVNFGWTLVKAGGTCTEGKMAKTAADGTVENATPTTDTEMIVGVFYSSGVSGDLVWLFVNLSLAAGA